MPKPDFLHVYSESLVYVLSNSLTFLLSTHSVSALGYRENRTLVMFQESSSSCPHLHRGRATQHANHLVQSHHLRQAPTPCTEKTLVSTARRLDPTVPVVPDLALAQVLPALFPDPNARPTVTMRRFDQLVSTRPAAPVLPRRSRSPDE